MYVYVYTAALYCPLSAFGGSVVINSHSCADTYANDAMMTNTHTHTHTQNSVADAVSDFTTHLDTYLQYTCIYE